MNYTDTQLKQALAKMLPDLCLQYGHLCWKQVNQDGTIVTTDVLDTELLHLCWLVEETLMFPSDEQIDYNRHLAMDCDYSQWGQVHATWQQRTIALAKVKGIEI